MAKYRKVPWTKIIPEKRLAALRWFYATLIPTLFDVEPPFRHSVDEQLVKDWQYPSWLEYYKSPPEGFLRLICLAVGAKEPPVATNRAHDSLWVLDIIQRLHGLATGGGMAKAQSEKVTEFSLPRLLPLKLSQFVILNHFACLFEHLTSLPSLIEAAQNGDADAMLKLVAVDCTFLELEPIRNKVRLATLFHDISFLEPLGRAVSSSKALSNLREHGDDFFLWLTWRLGFESAGVEQFGFFLRECGMRRLGSTSSLQRKLNRLGLSTK